MAGKRNRENNWRPKSIPLSTTCPQEDCRIAATAVTDGFVSGARWHPPKVCFFHYSDDLLHGLMCQEGVKLEGGRGRTNRGWVVSPALLFSSFVSWSKLCSLIVACFEEGTRWCSCCGAAHWGPELRGRAAPPWWQSNHLRFPAPELRKLNFTSKSRTEIHV